MSHSPELCPCGQAPFADCCQPIIEGRRHASTAEQLMRGRFTAFYKADALDFLLDTYLTEKPRSTIIQNFKKIFEERTWHHLTITDRVDGDVADDTGIVQFYAVYSTRDEPDTKQFTHERSSFTKQEDGRWYFCSSQSFKTIDLAPESACWCGSGETFGQCHQTS